MVNNGSKKGATLDMQAKVGSKKLKTRPNTETAHIKAELYTAI